MDIRKVVMLTTVAVLEGCCQSSTLASAVRAWSSRNLPQYRALVDEKYADGGTRQNAWKSMAALVCTADTAENKKDSAACRGQRSTDDAETQCKDFFDSLQRGT